MPPVRAQEVVRDESGRIAGGSASVAGAGRVAGARYHSRQRVRERLGRVAGLSEGGRSGVFRSPTRGLVRYDADPDSLGPPGRGDGAPTDESSGLPEPPAHVVAGDYLPLLSVPGRSGLPGVPGEAFPRDGDYGRLLAHLPRSPPRDGSRVSCDDLVARSAASHLLPDVSVPSPGSDSAYFHAMGSDTARVSLLRALASAARASDPSLGTCRHVGPAPLPGGLADNPPDALPSHGVGAAAPRSRLAPGPGDATGIPAWHGVTPGDAAGAGTLARVREDVEATPGAVSSAVLDAGHAARGLVGGEMRYLARMPARRGYPPEGMWHRARPQADRGKYLLAGGGHAYFGRHLARGVLGARTHLCACVDKDRAPSRLRQTRDGRPGEYEAMPGRDKDWEGARRLLRAHVQHGRDGPGLRARRPPLPSGGGAGPRGGEGPPAPAAGREAGRDGHARQGAARRHPRRGHAAGAQGRGRRGEVLVAHRPLGQVVVARVPRERSRPRARDAQQAVPAEVRGAGARGSREGGRRILPEGRPGTQVIVLHLAASWVNMLSSSLAGLTNR